IEEKIDYIKQRLNTEAVVSFRQLFGEKFTRNEVIATFLALLEIVRSKFARVKQSESFGEINIERVTSS
ncbi:hypothetical protein CO179_03095, partial [candidate division WWE3 bacterium CG_4_9_14_3_um_filter_39_7]